MKRWNKKFLSSTRGRVVQLLRRGPATVNELAEALALTDNAVRAHLTTLERDRLVQQTGKRPGVRKPETLYGLTADAEQLFPKAYHLLFSLLLDALNSRLSPGEVEELLREVGRKIAAEQVPPTSATSLRSRIEKAVDVLSAIGGLAEIKQEEDRFMICGYSCPLAAAVERHPEVCQLAEALLADVIGAPVQEKCDRSGAPRCVFEIGVGVA
jgi:predicted ArsR family transcriptional regulator